MYILDVSLDGEHLYLGGKGVLKVQSMNKDPNNVAPTTLLGRRCLTYRIPDQRRQDNA
jgi:hypothetical protein